jgi:predicted ABC-type sugar transport system permease subunit
MALGFGVFLIVIGAVLIWALDVDLSFVDDNTLGWILIIAGVLAIALSLIVNQQRNRHTTTHIDERRYDT